MKFQLSRLLFSLFFMLLLFINPAWSYEEHASCVLDATQPPPAEIKNTAMFIKALIPDNCNFNNNICTITWDLFDSITDTPLTTNVYSHKSELLNISWQVYSKMKEDKVVYNSYPTKFSWNKKNPAMIQVINDRDTPMFLNDTEAKKNMWGISKIYGEINDKGSIKHFYMVGPSNLSKDLGIHTWHINLGSGKLPEDIRNIDSNSVRLEMECLIWNNSQDLIEQFKTHREKVITPTKPEPK